MIRRFGEPPRNDKKYKLRPGAYAVLTRGDQMLITFQAAPDFEFQLPGGGIDPGESPLMALHREVYEETGWTIAQPVRLGAFRRFVFMPEYDLWAEKLCTIYAAHPASRLGPPTEPGHTAVWMSAPKAISVLANTGDQHFASSVLP
ncbi:8-oxo-dGTP diphosphatase [Shimia gijangensis]|uniref:8-oxo-dGTP diphosphatase n=1 Tax=Shimia gijangensis TaxID=1470563 RepID=A0A1M6MQ08_9RHOB|nr:NUDIX hydrolase [Shimia gijangensis]SHJ85595.1 8-oxo-dGTP diphosphatase [Shimia gijangensis]